MFVSREQILEFKKIIDTINNIKNIDEKKKFLNETVEDVDLFFSILKNIDKRKLNLIKKKNTKVIQKIYDKNEVLDVFSKGDIEEIIKNYSFKELSSMYFIIFDSNPISSYNKTRIAQTIYNYVYAMDRADYLLK